ncbi:hypothetical protein CR513_23058, partial [Mucuna pruriens]
MTILVILNQQTRNKILVLLHNNIKISWLSYYKVTIKVSRHPLLESICVCTKLSFIHKLVISLHQNESWTQIHLPDGSFLTTNHIGIINFSSNFALTNAFHLPTFHYNLIFLLLHLISNCLFFMILVSYKMIFVPMVESGLYILKVSLPPRPSINFAYTNPYTCNSITLMRICGIFV